MNPGSKDVKVARLLCDAAQTVGYFPPKFSLLFHWGK